MNKAFVKRIINTEFTYLFGFALFLSIVYGLLINSALPLLGVRDPLSYKYLTPVYLFFLLPFIKLLIEYIRWFKQRVSAWIIGIILVLNPLLAIAGVNYLDNTGDGSIAVASIVLVSFVFILTLIYAPSSKGIIKLSLYSSAISLLFANSLRSHFLVGWDIHQEYLVFQNTNLLNYWDINALRTAYNACLSITILPTTIHQLTGVPPMDVFRIIYPLIIALIPVIVYQIGTRITGSKVAYIGGFLFLIQNQFMAQLPALLRQSIAFVFFALMIDFILRININPKYKKWAILLSGIGVIWSHYSTTYIMMTLLTTAKIISMLINKRWPSKNVINSLSYKTLIGLFILAFSWNVLITDTASGLIHTIQKVLVNIGDTFTLENKSDMVKSVFYQKSNNSAAVNEYFTKTLQRLQNKETFENYKINPISLDTGRQLLRTDPVAVYFHFVIPWVFRVAIIVGTVFLFIAVIKQRRGTLAVSLSFAMFIFVLGIIVLPKISEEYNVERMLQQMLILLSPLGAVGLYKMFGAVKKIPSSIPVTIIVLSFLYQSSGFIDHLVFGTSNWMFSNSGESYFRYFTTSEEVAGVKWLEANTPPNTLLYTDKYTKLRLTAYSKQRFSYISNEINPPVIEKFGYVLSGFAGTRANAVFASVNGRALRFSFPEKYLTDTRNLIYSNSGAAIYR